MEECKDRLLTRMSQLFLARFVRMQPGYWGQGVGSAIAVATLLLCTREAAIAQQVVPDNTLGSENSVVTPNVAIQGIDSDRIDGGAQRGSNLFHSFQEFNVELNRGVYFSNPDGIDNILTRVTGSNLSNIAGTLGVLGGANLFLLNPNGIILGPEASLDLSGSFLGSTAASLLFAEFEFSAANPSAPPVLTINVPIGLQIGPNPGEIAVRSQSPGLVAAEATSLTLVGGEIRLEGGQILSPGADVQLAGLSEAGAISFVNGQEVQLPEGVSRADLSLVGGAQINVASDGGGSITAIARNVTLDGGSFIFAGISPDSTGGNTAGDVTIDA
ncbi:MAG: filamentous hemagglutinin N-terminal domain-containing protein, partial [Cyanobacteria bacterium J06641_5]